MEERIQKVMADRGICSRREAERLIASGKVKLNGHPVKLGDKMDPAKDFLSVNNETLRPVKKKEYVYYMLNKPRGYVTTLKDERGRKTVLELMEGVNERIYPVGRLDKDSEGLIIMTNDGALTNLIAHPSQEIQKLYRVTVRPHASEEQLIKLASGVILDDGSKTKQASVRVVGDWPDRSALEISIKEGKNRQIRRMCEAVGLEVIRLRRNAIGPVKLGMLKPGTYRELTPQEVSALKGSVGKASRAAKHKDGGK